MTERSSHDPLLETFVSWTEDLDRSVGLTLFVHGLVVTGWTIGPREFRDLMLKAGKRPGEPVENDDPEDVEPTPEEEGALDEPGIAFIHMKNVRVLQGSRDPWPQGGTLWRGRLDAVDGFMPGVLDLSDAPAVAE
jgi:hypothetical protein